LHGAEQLGCGHELVGIVKLDLHLPGGDAVEIVDGRLADMLSERGAGIDLHPPADRGRLGMDRGGGKRGRTRGQRAGGQEFPSGRGHDFTSVGIQHISAR